MSLCCIQRQAPLKNLRALYRDFGSAWGLIRCNDDHSESEDRRSSPPLPLSFEGRVYTSLAFIHENEEKGVNDKEMRANIASSPCILHDDTMLASDRDRVGGISKLAAQRW